MGSAILISIFSDYPKRLISRINEVYVILLKKKPNKLHLTVWFCCNHTCYCFGMVYVYIHPRSDSTKFHGIGRGNSECCYSLFWQNSPSNPVLSQVQLKFPGLFMHEPVLQGVPVWHSFTSNNRIIRKTYWLWFKLSWEIRKLNFRYAIYN